MLADFGQSMALRRLALRLIAESLRAGAWFNIPWMFDKPLDLYDFRKQPVLRITDPLICVWRDVWVTPPWPSRRRFQFRGTRLSPFGAHCFHYPDSYASYAQRDALEVIAGNPFEQILSPVLFELVVAELTR